MTPYKNLGGDSGVVSYIYGDDFIKVQFKPGTRSLYTYTNSSAGKFAIDHMKTLADAGRGLNSFISSNKPPYAEKI